MPADLIGRYAKAPATTDNMTAATLTLDMTNPFYLGFEIAGQRFNVGRNAMQALLDAYDDMQARLKEQASDA